MEEEKDLKAGYLGVPGSYSETALQRESQGMDDVEAIGYTNFPSLIDDLADKKISMAVIPVENSTTGFIARSADYFRHKPIVAVADRYETVQHTLLGMPGSKLEDITNVYSHPEALSQCDTFFEKHPNLEAKAYSDTARAAEFIKNSKSLTQAAISSPRAGELYGLQALERDIQTEKSNMTRFYVMKHEDDVTLKGSHLALYVEIRHEPSSLSKLLQAFGLLQINLLSLNARPIPGKPFAYGFYIEIDMTLMTVEFDILWALLEQASEYLQILGQFNRKKTNPSH